MKGEINLDIDGLVQGNNKSILPITVTKKGSVENIEGATVRVAIKHGDSLFTKQAVITDAANGKCEVTLTREDLAGSGWHFYQPTITFPDDREFTGGIDRFNVSGKLSGPVPVPVPNGIDLNRLGINASGRLTIDGVEQIGGTGGGGSVPSNVILFEDWTGGESVTIDTGTTAPPADTTAPVLTISPNGGNFASTQGVTMTANETADIYYTLDGSTPTTASTKYTVALSLSATTTLKAFARDTAGNSSAVQTVTFTKDVTAPADTTAPVVTASPAAGAYTSAQSVTLSANETATIYYTTNGTTPTTASSVYSSPISIGATTNLQYMAKDAAGNQSTPVSATYTINIPQADTTAPVLTMPAAATFTDTQTVTMSANETADIWYTVDGSDPKVSATRVKYSAPVTLTATTTVKAYAVDTAGNASGVQTVVYTKQTATATTVLSFDGNDYLGLKTVPLPNNTIPVNFTVKVRMKANSGQASHYGLFCATNTIGLGRQGFTMRNSTRTMAYWDSSNGWKDSGYVLEFNTWYDLEWRYFDAVKVEFYVNGELKSTQTLTTSYARPNNFWVGKTNETAEYFNGHIQSAELIGVAKYDFTSDANYLANNEIADISGNGRTLINNGATKVTV